MVVPLPGMNPNVAGQVARCLDQLSPVFPAIDITLIRTGRAEGNAETDNETQDGEEDIRNYELILVLADAGNKGGPATNKSQRNKHPRRDAALKAQEVGQLGVFIRIARAGEVVFHIDAAFAFIRLNPRSDMLAWARGCGFRADVEMGYLR